MPILPWPLEKCIQIGKVDIKGMPPRQKENSRSKKKPQNIALAQLVCLGVRARPTFSSKSAVFRNYTILDQCFWTQQRTERMVDFDTRKKHPMVYKWANSGWRSSKLKFYKSLMSYLNSWVLKGWSSLTILSLKRHWKFTHNHKFKIMCHKMKENLFQYLYWWNSNLWSQLFAYILLNTFSR